MKTKSNDSLQDDVDLDVILKVSKDADVTTMNNLRHL